MKECPEIATLLRRQNRKAVLQVMLHLILAVILFHAALFFGIGLLFAFGFFDASDLLIPGRIWTYSYLFAVCTIPIGLGVRWFERRHSPFVPGYENESIPTPPNMMVSPRGMLRGMLGFFVFHIVLGVSEQLGKAWGSCRRIAFLTSKEEKAGERILEWLRGKPVPPRFHDVSRVKMDPRVVSKLARAQIFWYKIEDGLPMMGLNRAFDLPSGDTD